MAGERCNLDKDEAELLKPPSTAASSPPPPPPPTSPHTPQQPSMSTATAPPLLFLTPPVPHKPDAASATPAIAAKAIAAAQPPARLTNRCSSCRKKVGLTGFRCRCGELFCGRHRYSDAHGCSFDYKALGREEISRNNPVVRAAKILKI